MPTLISNCSDTKALSAAFSKVKDYAAKNSFKLQKAEADVLKMMAACTAQKPPDKPEVKFEDNGMAITCTVGKAKKVVTNLGAKNQSPSPALKLGLAKVEALVTDVSGKVGDLLLDMTKISSNYAHFVNMGAEGVNALSVVVKEMQAKGNASANLGGFKTNATVAKSIAELQQIAAKAEDILKQWTPLATRATQFQAVIKQVQAEADKIIALAPTDKAKGLQTAMDGLAADIKQTLEFDAPPTGAVKFIRVDDSTTVANLKAKETMDFQDGVNKYQQRIKAGTDKIRSFREQHTGML